MQSRQESQEYRTASELLAQDARPEQVVRQLRMQERQLQRYQRWLRAHEARIRFLEDAIHRLSDGGDA